MSSQSLRDAYRSFTTTCSLITTNGAEGPNVMAAEWTFNVSYNPFRIMVLVDPGNRTHDMILESKEFGVNLVAEDQAAAMAFAGHYSKSDTEKLSSDIFQVIPAKRIHAPMIRGALLNAECRLVAHYPLGDHTAFLGEVLEFSVDPEKPPLVLHHGSRRLGERIVREPGLVLAVTPVRAKAGDLIAVTGELTGPGRGHQVIQTSLRDPAGNIVAEAKAVTDEEGTFHTQLGIPSAVGIRSWRVEARSGDLAGFAHFEALA